MAVGYLFVQALKENGKDLTRPSIEKTIAKGDLTGSGIVPMRFSTDDHTGYGGARMGKISNGTQQYFGPTYTTDDSDSEPEVYDGPANMPPAGAIPEK